MPVRRFALLLVVLALAAVSLPAAARSGAPSAMFVIPFASGPVDPARDWSAADPKGMALVLVQADRFGAVGVVEAIAATGATLVQPLAPVSYIVAADAVQTRAMRALDGVRWAGAMPATAKVARSVTGATTRLRVTLVGAALPAGMPSGYVTRRAFTGVDGTVVVLPGGAAAATALAALPSVYSVADAGGRAQLRDERTAQVVATGGRAPAPVPGYRDFLTGIGADGTGVLISHVDGGVDMTHPELSSRIAGCIDYLATANAGCTAKNHDDAIGHGTHTLGIVLGTGSTGLGDAAGHDYGLGVAPGAKAIVQNAINVADGMSAFDNGYVPVYQAAQDLGAIVSQNSWGPTGSPQGYDEVTREFDSIVRDTDPTEAGDQPMGLVFSVMNGSGGVSTQGSPDEGKNLIGVGGTGSGRGTPGMDDLCTCSAHGPALDGRFLPTIVAPGQNVMSTRAAQGTLCGLPHTGAQQNTPSPLHATCTGTSMASPHVAGAYAVFVDWYRDRHAGATPSPALVKAALVNGAVDLAGAKNADGATMSAIPNNQQGWGRLNIANTVNGLGAGLSFDQETVFTEAGQSFIAAVAPVDQAKPLKITLAWTDALGPGLGDEVPAWVNDLDLVVTAADGTTWRGNVFAQGMSVAAGEADRKNNLENVFLPAPGPGPYTVTVEASNLIGDGMPNREGAVDQDFALVVANGRAA